MQARLFRQLGAVILGCTCGLLAPGVAPAQTAAPLPSAPAPTPAASIYTPPVRHSIVEIYGAYSYFHPVSADINNFYDQPINPGAIAGANYYFTKYLGAEVEGGFHPHGPNDCAATAQGGLVARYQFRYVAPFAHALIGGSKLGGPVFQPCTWGVGFTAGLGLDYILPAFDEHIAIRPVQADYEYNRVSYGPLVIPGGYAGGLMKMNAYRLSSGVVLRLGNQTPPTPVALACAISPADVYPGESVTVTAKPSYLYPKRKTVFTWQSTGGEISGSAETILVSTNGLAPGSYTVKGKVLQGPKPTEQAECTSQFTVKRVIEPPTITCSASPRTVLPSGTATITAQAVSPDNRPLTYSYTTTGGVVTGTGATATLTTAGVSTGTITVTCTATDDLGKAVSATTSVQVLPAELPPAPKTQALCSIAFDRDTKRPARVDNEAKGCLDDIALTLQRQADSTLVVTGSHDPETEGAALAAERAVNTKLYLTKEKGIDPSRIQVRTGGTDGHRVSNTLVPAGATFTGAGSTLDESKVKDSGQPYGVPKHKAAAKKKK